MPKFTRVRLVALFVLIAAGAVLSGLRFGRETEASKRAVLAPAVTSTMTAALVNTGCPGASATDGTCNGLVNPGDTIRYTATITNGPAGTDALNAVFTDQLPSTLTLVAGSLKASPVAMDDTYPVAGNVRIQKPAGTLLANDFRPTTGNSTGLSVTAIVKSSANCTGSCTNNVNIGADGSFKYDPPVGFEGAGATADSFTYTITDPDGLTGTGTVKLDVSGMIWFIKNNATACTTIAAGCGRLTSPFSDLASFAAANVGGGSNPDINDNIFIYNTGVDYVASLSTRSGQKVIGQGASASLSTITGIVFPADSDTLPITGGARPVITNPAGVGINVSGGNNTIRGVTIGNVAAGVAFKIGGVSFGTLTVGDSASPDVQLTGTGRALDLTTGSFGVTSGFVDITSTSSGMHGINLSGVGGAVNFGNTTIQNSSLQGINISGSTVNATFGTTQVTSPTTQGILIGTSTGTMGFGATTITGGTDGVSFQNNSGTNTKTFASLNVSGGSGNAFLHGAGGGNVTVSGAATLSSANSAISVSAPGGTNAISFGATTATSTTAGTTAVNWVGTAGASMTFNSLSITRNNATALNATTGGTITVTNNTGSITNTTPAGPAITAANVTLNAKFGAINSTAGTNLVSLNTVAGTSDFGGGALTGTAGGSDVVQIQNGSLSLNYAGTVTNNGAGKAILVQSETGTGTFNFSGLITDASATHGQGVAMISNSAGTTVNYTGGLNISTGGNPAFTATGGGTVSATQNNTSIVNTLVSTTGTALNVASTNIGASGLTFHSISANGGTNGIILNNTGGGPFHVTGDGSNVAQGGNGSGGTIQNLTGADGTTQLNGASNGIGLGVYLNNASNVTLERMNIHDASNFAVEVEASSNFVMKYTAVGGTNGSSAGQEESSVRLLETSGTNTLDNNNISGGFTDNVRLDNHTAALTDLIFSNNNIHDNNSTTGNQGFLVDFVTGAAQTLHITGNTCSHVRAECVFIGGSGGAVSAPAVISAVVTNNIFTGNRSTDLGGGFEIQAANFNGHLLYDISGNTLKPVISGSNFAVNQGSAIQVSDTGSSGSLLEGRINNNQIGTTGVPFSGTQQGSGITVDNTGSGTHTTLITNNTILRYGNTGLAMTVGGSTITTGTLNATITGNTIGQTSATSAGSGTPNGINGNFGTNSGNAETVNLDISSNTTGGSGTNVNIGEEDIRLRQRFTTDVFLKGYGGGLSDTAAVVTFLQSSNIGAETASASVFSSPPHGFHNIASVPQPTVPTIALPADENGVAGIELSPASVETASALGEIASVEFTTPSADSATTSADRAIGSATCATASADRAIDSATCATASATCAIDSATCATASATCAIDSATSAMASALGAAASAESEIRPAEPANGPSTFAMLTEIAKRAASEVSPTVYSQGIIYAPENAELVTVNGSGTGFTIPANKTVTIVFDAKVQPVGTIPANTFSVSHHGSTSGTSFGPILTDGDPVAVGQQDTVTTIVQPETIQIGYNPTIAFLNGTSKITYTITNANPGTGASAITFIHDLPVLVPPGPPAGIIRVANPTGLINTCGGSVTDAGGLPFAAGNISAKLTGGNLLANATCTISFNVQALQGQSGSATNATLPISSLEGAVGQKSNNATITFATLTSAGVSVSGRVTYGEGRGIRGATVTLTNTAGESRSVLTGPRGTYQFTDVPTGDSYTISVSSRRFNFIPKIITVTDELTDLDFNGTLHE